MGFRQKRKRTLSIRVAGAGRAGRHGLRELVGDGKVIRCSAVSLEELLHQECQSGQADDGGDVAAIVEGGGTATAIGDVADESDVAALFDAAEELCGGVDVVVHTGGIMVLSPLAELELDVLDAMIRVNLRGTFVVGREAARRVRPGGAIIPFSSSVVKIALPAYSGYAATKAGVDAMTLILARELRGRDVTVNAVAPGPTATPLFLDGKEQSTIDHLAQMAPLGRLGRPEDIAEVVAFLAGPARWVNGQTIYVNGGVI